MKTLSIIGNFAKGKHVCNGQSIKTRIIANELLKVHGTKNVKMVDTSNSLTFLFKSIFSITKCLAISKNLIIMPAQNGILIILPLVTIINIIFKRKIHYVVIGGWLCDFVYKHIFLLHFLKNLNVIYTETSTLKNGLQELGLRNVKVMPNCKPLTILKQDELTLSTRLPIRFCTFSRVIKSKGIEDAILAIIKCNQHFPEIVATLDIYGKIEEQTWFDSLQTEFPAYIKYKGIAMYNNSVQTLKEYNALLFPTYYQGEGIAGTIIDALSAGLPIIASDWHDNNLVIQNKETGFLFKTHDIDHLTSILINVCKNPTTLTDMKINCINKAQLYQPENVICILNTELDL